MGRCAGVNESIDGFDGSDNRRDEDRRDNGKPRVSFSPARTQQERDAEWHRGQCIAAVVNQVGEQGDAA